MNLAKITVEWVFGDVIQGYMNYRKGKQKLDTKMCKFREIRQQFLYVYCDNNLINDKEFILLYDLNTSKNLDLQNRLYFKCDLKSVSNDEQI